MTSGISDQELRAALHRLAPDVDENGVWESLHGEDASGPNLTPGAAGRASSLPARVESTERRGLQGLGSTRTRRALSIGAVVVVVLAALGFGLNALVQYLAQDEQVVVITDDPMQPGSSSSTPGSYLAELPVGEPVDLIRRTSAPYVWSAVLSGRTVAYVESDSYGCPIPGAEEEPAQTAAIKILDLATGDVTAVSDGEMALPAGAYPTPAYGTMITELTSPIWSGDFRVWPWWLLAELPTAKGDDAEPSFLWGRMNNEYAADGTHRWEDLTGWNPREGTKALLSSETMARPPIRTGDVLALPLTSPGYENEHGGRVGTTIGEELLLYTGSLDEPVAVDPAAPVLPANLLEGISPYVSWSGWLVGRRAPVENAPQFRDDLPGQPPRVFDLRSGELVNIAVEDPRAPESWAASVVAGHWAAWVAVESDAGEAGLYLADLTTGRAERLLEGILGEEVPRQIGLSEDWLLWTDASGDLVGYHLPDLTPVRVPTVLAPGEYDWDQNLQISGDLVLLMVVAPSEIEVMSRATPPQWTAIRLVRLPTPEAEETVGSVPAAQTTAEYVSVLHPYHNEFLDAPLYLIPETITVAQELSLPDFPQSIPAQRITSETLPDTGLDLMPKPSGTGHYLWFGPGDDLTPDSAILGSQDTAAEAARDFLEAHALWNKDYSEPKVGVGSSETGPDGTTITSWAVMFERDEAAPGLPRYVSVRVGNKDEVTQVSLAIPRVEPLEDKLVKLRPVSEVVADRKAWGQGEFNAARNGTQDGVQSDIQGVVDVEIKGVSLAYRDPGSGAEPIAVPVYCFEVEVQSADGGGSMTGIWTVVAAADVVRTAAGTTTDSSSQTSQRTLDEQMPEDFGFVAAYGVEARNVIDTLAGTFTKDLGPSEQPVTTELSLSREALDGLYRDLVLIQNQWQVFTEGFAPSADPSNTGTTMHVTPSLTYTLKWSAGGFDAQPISWNDDALSADLEAIALRNWFGRLQQLIETTPEWKALPPMKGGYN